MPHSAVVKWGRRDEMKHQYQDGTLCLYFEGEFDNLSVMKLKEPSIRLIEQYRPRVLKLDFEKVSFVDSTGIGYVLARYKQMKKTGGETIVCNLSRLNKTIFEMSGIFRIIRYERNEGRR